MGCVVPWVTVDDGLERALADRLAVLGYERLEDWAGVENLEDQSTERTPSTPSCSTLRRAST